MIAVPNKILANVIFVYWQTANSVLFKTTSPSKHIRTRTADNGRFLYVLIIMVVSFRHCHLEVKRKEKKHTLQAKLQHWEWDTEPTPCMVAVQHVCFPSGVHAHCNQHESAHCVSRAQPLIWTATWGSGFQLYIRGIDRLTCCRRGSDRRP